MTNGRAPVAVAALFFVGACVAAFVIGTPARSVRGERAAQAFLTTWRQSRLATFVVSSEFTRTLRDGNSLHETVQTVQRPPDDRLVFGFGSTAGRLGGLIVRCASAPDGTSRCFTSSAAPAYNGEVDAEIATLEQYVMGPRPLYRVIEFSNSPDHCFRLDLALAVLAPPYGNQAMFCFNRTNLAPTLTVIVRDDATDRTEAKEIRTTVTAGDLELQADPGQVVGFPGPPTSTTTVPGSSGSPDSTVPPDSTTTSPSSGSGGPN
jgi:hypothetical protein